MLVALPFTLQQRMYRLSEQRIDSAEVNAIGDGEACSWNSPSWRASELVGQIRARHNGATKRCLKRGIAPQRDRERGKPLGFEGGKEERGREGREAVGG